MVLTSFSGLSQKDSIEFEILFSNGFNNESIELFIGKRFSEELLLKSNPNYGKCNAELVGTEFSKKRIMIFVNLGNGRSDTFYLKKRKKYKLRIEFDTFTEEFTFRPKDGKYLLIYRDAHYNKVFFGQRGTYPSFD